MRLLHRCLKKRHRHVFLSGKESMPMSFMLHRQSLSSRNFYAHEAIFYVHGVKKKVENAVNTKKIYTFAAAYKA